MRFFAENSWKLQRNRGESPGGGIAGRLVRVMVRVGSLVCPLRAVTDRAVGNRDGRETTCGVGDGGLRQRPLVAWCSCSSQLQVHWGRARIRSTGITRTTAGS